MAIVNSKLKIHIIFEIFDYVKRQQLQSLIEINLLTFASAFSTYTGKRGSKTDPVLSPHFHLFKFSPISIKYNSQILFDTHRLKINAQKASTVKTRSFELETFFKTESI